MSKVPWWYWPVALVPGAVFIAVAWLVFRTHASVFEPVPLALGMFFSAYAAMVLLGYLLLAVGQKRRATPLDGTEALKPGVRGDH